MAEVFEIRAIKPERMKTENFERAVNTSLDKSAKIIKKDFQGTQRTFRTKEPVVITKGKFRRIIFVDGRIYSFISKGTKIRWALMSSDWKSKTAPRRLAPGRGAGRAVIMGKRAMLRRGIPPRPGIKAREFDKEIVKRRASDVQRDMERAITSAARNLF